MKQIIILIFFPNILFAHCPIELKIDDNVFCTKIEWLNGEQKIQGQFQTTAELSPQLILKGEIPQSWIYSTAQLIFWKKGDPDHKPQVIENFRTFPYMTMENGHHHMASYRFDWTPSAYQLSALAFQEMPGCWSLRWTTAKEDSFEDSQLLINVANYKNISGDENLKMFNYCSNSESADQEGEHHSH